MFKFQVGHVPMGSPIVTVSDKRLADMLRKQHVIQRGHATIIADFQDTLAFKVRGLDFCNVGRLALPMDPVTCVDFGVVGTARIAGR